MSPTELPIQKILKTWWPLAASWMLMSAELPALVATMARLPNPKINLAAYGGVVFPLALIIEGPIRMLQENLDHKLLRDTYIVLPEVEFLRSIA